MITYNNDEVRLYGLSTDAKPTDGIENGTTFVEIDTSDQYYFNEAAGEWVKKNSSVGGGLPTPTMADNGKAVVVSATATDGAVIVPEQTGTLTGSNFSFVCQNVDEDLFTEGTHVIAYEEGARYETTVLNSGGILLAELDDTHDRGFVIYGGEFLFYDNGKELYSEVTVKLVVRGADSYSFGFGVRGLKVTASKGVIYEGGSFQFYDDDMTLDKTWAEISSAVESGVPVYLVADIDGLQDTEAKAIWQLQSYGYRTNEYMVTFTIATQNGATEATFISSTPDGTLMP